MIFKDILFEKQNNWAELYSPTRKNIKAAGTFFEENLNAAREMIMGHVESGKIENIEMLNPGEGGTIKKGINHFAVYRDEDGLISLCSAVCTHLGCIVQWNSAEKTFDCPCHGSRFNAKGEVMTGPAIRNLKKVEIEVGTIS